MDCKDTQEENIFEILENSFIILREYLQLKVMQLGFDANINEKEWFFPSQIIQNLGKIVEEIHNFDIVKNSDCKRKDRGLICGYTDKITMNYIINMKKKNSNSNKLQEKIYFLWNDDKYAKVLKEKIGKERIITSDNDLTNLLRQNKNIDGLIILAELTWNGKKFYEAWID